MIYGEKKRAVSFNLNKEDERRLYEMTLDTNFSQLVKRLLAAELAKRPQSSIQVNMGE